MIIELDEKAASDFAGTIIDIETIGDFNRLYQADSRRYSQLTQVILGYITRERLHIYCAKDTAGIDELRSKTPGILEALPRPLHAFNCAFERGVWFHHAGIEVLFDGELQERPFEAKKDAVSWLGISNYDDPFYDIGFECMKAWRKGDFSKAIAHNRACLLKERDILLKRGCVAPGTLLCISGD